MSAVRSIARSAGWLYLAFSLLAVAGYMVVPNRFVVPGDAAATASRIVSGEGLYRVGILAALVAQFVFMWLAITLYRLFRDVDRGLALMLLVLVCSGATAEILVLAFRMAPLVLLDGAGGAVDAVDPQRQAMALDALRLGRRAGQLLTAYWGLWLFPFGALVIRSRFFPRVLGLLLFVSGFAYLAACVVRLAAPTLWPALSPFVTPLYIGEIAMVLWMAVVGARPPQGQTG